MRFSQYSFVITTRMFYDYIKPRVRRLASRFYEHIVCIGMLSQVRHTHTQVTQVHDAYQVTNACASTAQRAHIIFFYASSRVQYGVRVVSNVIPQVSFLRIFRAHSFANGPDDGTKVVIAELFVASTKSRWRNRRRGNIARRNIAGGPCVSVVEVFKVRAERCIFTVGHRAYNRPTVVAHDSLFGDTMDDGGEKWWSNAYAGKHIRVHRDLG